MEKYLRRGILVATPCRHHHPVKKRLHWGGHITRDERMTIKKYGGGGEDQVRGRDRAVSRPRRDSHGVGVSFVNRNVGG